MDWLYKAVLTGAMVAAAMMMARLMGRRAAGLLAGLPVITVPALLWVTQEQGTDFAMRSAVGSAAACAMAPLFAASFVLLAQRFAATLCMAGAVLVACVAMSLLHVLDGRPGPALAAVALSCVLVQWLLGHSVRRVWGRDKETHSGSTAGPARELRALAGEPWVTAALAGIVSATVSLSATTVGPYWSGVLSTLPLISAFTMLHLHRTCGPSALPGFVSGYVVGVLAKALFVCSFAWLAPPWGAAPALALAVLIGAAAAVTLSRWRRGRGDTASPAAVQVVRPRAWRS